MHVVLDRVLLRDSSLTPEEILMSESQEQMCAVVVPDNVDAFMAICRKWDVEAVVIGEVTATGRLTVDWHGEQIVDVPPRSVAHDGPVYEAHTRGPPVRMRCRRTAPEISRARPMARNCATPCFDCSPHRILLTSPSSPTSTTGTCRATPCWLNRKTRGSFALMK